VREALPLQLPKEMTEQAQQEQAEQEQGPATNGSRPA
jgi:hypothetical protein